MKPVQYNVPTLVRRIVGLLPSGRRRQLGYLFLGMLAVAGMETFFLGGVALFVSSVSSPEQVLNSTYAQRFQAMMDISTISHQQLILWTALLSVAMVVMKNSLQLALTYASSRFSGTLAAYFGNRLLAAFLSAPYQWHLKRNSADLVLAVEWRTYLGGKLFNPLLLLLKDVADRGLPPDRHDRRRAADDRRGGHFRHAAGQAGLHPAAHPAGRLGGQGPAAAQERQPAGDHDHPRHEGHPHLRP